MTIIEQIANQLSSYCDCVGDFTTRDVTELINAVSIATGWTREPCETFLLSSRREVIDLPSCMECVFEFEPFYHPYTVESFSFTLIKQDGLTEESTSITDYIYSTVDEKFKLTLPLPDCKCECVPACSDCEPTYKLLVDYEAGYEEIPECLLPAFCDLLQVIIAKNTCDCTCDNCEGNNEDEIQYAKGDVVTVELQTQLGKIIVQQYLNQLGMLNLYNVKHTIWGYVL